jgi:carbamoyl-phosphate synthase large subunit
MWRARPGAGGQRTQAVKRILVTGAGGAPALNFVRSLRLADEPFYIVGVDADPYRLMRAETDEKLLIPKSRDGNYLPVLRQIIEETSAEMIFAQPDVEIAVLSEHRDELPVRTFWPRRETVRACQDKYVTYRLWREHGLAVAETRELQSEADLADALREFGDIWLRLTTGAAGRGAFHTNDLDEARAWISFNGGYNGFTASRYLSPDSITWQSIWNKGELVVAQGRRRISWEFADRSPSGVTGITGVGVTVSDEALDEIALRAIKAVDPEPHGIFSVDLTYDSSGVPNPTEINIGRFFTTHLFFSEAGLNMPLIAVRIAFGEPAPNLERRVNPLPPGLVWVRGMDRSPVLTDQHAVDEVQEALQTRISALREKPEAVP